VHCNHQLWNTVENKCSTLSSSALHIERKNAELWTYNRQASCTFISLQYWTVTVQLQNLKFFPILYFVYTFCSNIWIKNIIKLPVFWNSVNISERRQKRQNGSQLKIEKRFRKNRWINNKYKIYQSACLYMCATIFLMNNNRSI
jgi:hypothetical protein